MSKIRLDVKDFVAVATLDNPPVNAQPMEVLEELTAVFDSFNDRDDVRVVVLTGAGKMFSAGADLKQRPDLSIPGARWRRNRIVREVSYAIADNAKPVIAAVNGPALGAGLGLVASCDVIVASESAVFGLPEVDVGLMGGGKHAGRIFPHSLVRRMMLTGYRVPAAEAFRRGVIEACLPADDLMPWVMDMATQIASKSPLATKMAKDSMRTIETMTLRDGYIYEQGNTAKLSTTHDAAEAVRAFVEKRAPQFIGS
ncbi:enoyl-CoA hydratase/isomerase family protein [Pararhodobacter zhoushanensis]|uniref:Enoyl-CoA hydratase/isomerase family protein n=1 Tax=Pararhodobacter zhoushanensis TaxID=2479545 RepID=A0ABT3H1B3_9RHOB|nr:enoyl-CoA hydratase/isomerase family protein [Pararhodobacter zhoushanensis]MCW1933576.1 enoyl-CoA hydratase/isomerase family protein [Pararhodobacter zhoushanensis]